MKLVIPSQKEMPEQEKRPPFMTFLDDSILGAGKMVLIVSAMVIAYVALSTFVNALLGLTQFTWLKLENILGVLLFPFAFYLVLILRMHLSWRAIWGGD